MVDSIAYNISRAVYTFRQIECYLRRHAMGQQRKRENKQTRSDRVVKIDSRFDWSGPPQVSIACVVHLFLLTVPCLTEEGVGLGLEPNPSDLRPLS